MASLINKVSVITGSGKGLGRAFAEYLLKNGSKVVVSDVDPALVQATHDELKEKYGSQVHMEKCDVTSIEDMEALFSNTKANLGDIHLVCNNAGIMHETHWRKSLDINLTAMIHGTQLALQYMSPQNGGKGGSVVNVSSAAGLNLVPFAPVYCAGKHGIIAYSQSLAAHKSTLEAGVRINCLCPTFADTDIIKITREHVLGLGFAVKSLKEVGLMPVEKVVGAFARLVEDDAINGKAMLVTPELEKLMGR